MYRFLEFEWKFCAIKTHDSYKICRNKHVCINKNLPKSKWKLLNKQVTTKTSKHPSSSFVLFAIKKMKWKMNLDVHQRTAFNQLPRQWQQSIDICLNRFAKMYSIELYYRCFDTSKLFSEDKNFFAWEKHTEKKNKIPSTIHERQSFKMTFVFVNLKRLLFRMRDSYFFFHFEISVRLA